MLQTSGAITMSDVAVELGLPATANLTLDDSRVRKLAKREPAGSAIGLADLYGKSNLEYEIHLWRLLWRSYSSPGGPKWEYLYGLKFIVNTPPGVIITGLAAYNSDGTTLFDQPLTGGDNYGWKITDDVAYVKGAGGYVWPTAASSVNNPTNYLWLFDMNTSRPSRTYHRFVLTDSNGNKYSLDKHRDIAVSGHVAETRSLPTGDIGTIAPNV